MKRRVNCARNPRQNGNCLEQCGSELPTTEVKKETWSFMLDSVICLTKGSMSVLLERHIFLILNFNVKV